MCWDGASAAERAGCTRPTGASGLAWVFPSFNPTAAGCYDALVGRPDIKRPTMWECNATVGGSAVLLRYSELGDTTTGRDYYEDQYAAGTRETVSEDGRPVRYVWRLPAPNADGTYKLSAMYVNYPYSISVESSSLQARDNALATLFTFRRPQDIKGE